MLDGAAGTDIDLQHDSMDNDTRPISDDLGESDDKSEISAELQLEPRRPHSTETPIQDIDIADTTDDDPAQTGMGGLAESQLKIQPFVVPYPNPRVEDPTGALANASYELEIAQDKMNQYAPFPSQLDWDIAKWAKLRGPGSTSFDELLAIPSVCVSLCLVESGQVMLFRYMRGFRHHSEPPKNSIRSSTTTYQGGHRFNVMKSCLATKYVRCTIETSSLAFAPCLETQTLPQCWCSSLRSTMSTRKKRSVCIMTYRLDGGGGARR